MKLPPGFVLDQPKGSSLPPGFVIDSPDGDDSSSMDLSAQNRFTVNAAPLLDSLTMDNVKSGASDLWSGVKRGVSSMASMPGDIAQAQFEKLFKAKNELEAGNKGQALSDLASGLTPLVPVAQNMAQQSVSQIQRAGTEAGKGDYLSAANEMAKAVPMTGPMAGQWGEDVASGHPLTAVGEAATFALAPDVAGKVPKVPGAVAEGLRAASPALKEAAAIAKDAYGAKIRMYRPTAGEAALSGAAAMAGGPQAAAAVYAALKLPKVIKAVAKGIAERKSISLAKAQAEALKMSNESLLSEAQALDIAPKIDLSVEFSPENLSVYPEVVAKARELLQKGAPEEAISKSLEGHKYPQGLIDRVLKEAKAPEPVPEAPKPPQETISAPETPKEPAKATESPKKPSVEAGDDLEGALKASLDKKDVVYAPPAFPGQQGAKGATKARFEMVAERNKSPQRAVMSEIERASANVKKWVKSNTKPEKIKDRLNSIFKGKRSFSTEEVETLIKIAQENE